MLVRLFLLTSLFCLVASAAGSAQTVYAVVLGNQKYIVGSSTLHSGLYRSRDGARTWEHLGPENLKAFSMDAVEKTNGQTLFIAAGNGVHRSTDAGRTWKIVTDWRMTEVLDVRVDQADPRWVYAATAWGFWRSGDGGDTWSQPLGALYDSYVYKIDELEWPGGIYASTDSALYESIDYGSTWREVTRAQSPRGLYSLAGTSSLVATGEGPMFLDRTMDGSLPQTGRPVMNTYAIAFDPSGGAYAAGDRGVWSTHLARSIGGWQDISGNIPSKIVHALAWLDSGELLAGTFGDGLYRYDGRMWKPSGLDGSQVWRLKVMR